MSLHIYRAAMQPATCFDDHLREQTHTTRIAPHKRLWAMCCDKRRLAKNLVVQVYYDATYFWCAPGKGCKDPAYIAARKRREFRNRSRGQKRRWAPPVAEGGAE